MLVSERGSEFSQETKQRSMHYQRSEIQKRGYVHLNLNKTPH